MNGDVARCEPADASGSAPLVSPRPVAILSSTEVRVLALISEGAQNAEIARTLAVPLPAIEVHVASILRKLAVSTRGAATTWFLRCLSESPTRKTNRLFR